MANETAATGVAELDRALDGLYWGDNVQVAPGSGPPVLRRGETLLASRCGIDAWRFVGDTSVQCLWVLRD
jgi:hypothetical protein